MSRGDFRQRVNIRYSVRTPGSSDFSTPASFQCVLSLQCIFSRLGLFPYYLRHPWVIYSLVIRLYLTPPLLLAAPSLVFAFHSKFLSTYLSMWFFLFVWFAKVWCFGILRLAIVVLHRLLYVRVRATFLT